MTPLRLDQDTIQRRLRLMRDSLDHLGQLGGISATELDANALTRAAGERLLQVIIDLAVDINGHIVVALSGKAPETGRSSFLDLAECGVISDELAVRIAPLASLRNILVHQYVDVRTDLVAAAISATTTTFPDDIEAIAGFLVRRRNER
jgi:uncharacterized protein YutE (UPF0331/DUF86 family)